MLMEGIYGLSIQRVRQRRRLLDPAGEALVVLRNGTILGSGPWGGVFTGIYGEDSATGQDTVKIQIDVPPGGELVTGFTAGPSGASIDVIAAFDRAIKARRANVEIAGTPVEIAVSFLGPVPH